MSAENTDPEQKVVGRPFPPGVSGNPGGRPKRLAEIEAMLDEQHRTAANMREVFARLRVLAMGEIVEVAHKDGTVVVELSADARFMQLYLDRVMGPVKEIPVDLSGVSEGALAELRQVLKQ